MGNIRNAVLAFAFLSLVTALPALYEVSDAIVPEHHFEEHAPMTRMLEEKTETKASVTTSTILTQAKNDIKHKCVLVKADSSIQTSHANGQAGDGDETFARLASMAVSSTFECMDICTSLDESALTFSKKVGFGLAAAGQTAKNKKLICRGEAPDSGSVATTQCGPLEEVKKGLCSSGDGTQLLQAGTGNSAWGGALMTSGSFTMMPSGADSGELAHLARRRRTF